MITPIKITGMARRGEEDSINASFDSIEKIINAWEPKTIDQNYNVFTYVGELSVNQEITTKRKPFENTPIFAMRGQTYTYVGDLLRSGVFRSRWDSEGDIIYIFQVYPAKMEGAD